MGLVPVGYALAAVRFLQARRRRAATDPAWAARASGQRSATVVATFVASLVLGILAGVVTCFAVLFALGAS
jgi:formate/nitrite transporter FocA (FNT family)